MKASEASKIANIQLKPFILSEYDRCLAHIKLASHQGNKDCLVVVSIKVINEVGSLLINDGYKVGIEPLPDNANIFPDDPEQALLNISWRGI